MIAAALSMISGVAMSKERSTHCNALDAGPIYNKVELSEKDKCWLNHWKADEQGGTLGSIFWVRIGTDFVSMKVRNLQISGSERAAKEIVVNKVIDTMVVGVAQDVHDALVAERDQLVNDLGTANTDLADQIEAIGLLNADITAIYAAIEAGGLGSATTPAGAEARINDIVGTIAALRTANTTYAIENFTYSTNLRNAMTKANNILGYSDSELFVNQSRGSNYEVIEDRDDVIQAGKDANNSTLNIYNDGIGARVRTADSTSVALISVYGTVENRIIQVRQAVEAAFDEGFEAGFNEGYDRGYNDGYRDGFRDGVNQAHGQ